MLNLALHSLWNRRFVASLTILSIALAVALILGVERLRDSARASFANSASGIDLIVAPRGNDVQILMATVFGVGSTGTGMTWQSFEQVENFPAVDWAVPLMMGDNHRGYPVMGTTGAYFDHFRHSGGKDLDFAQGGGFEAADSAVIGAEVAARFGYNVGTVIVNAHGAGDVSFDVHDDAPFTVTGTLAATGTAVDRMVFVSTEGFDALHAAYDTPAADPLADPMGGDVPASGGENDAENDDHAHNEHNGHDGHNDHEAPEDDHAEDGHDDHDDAHHEDEESHKGHAHEETSHATPLHSEHEDHDDDGHAEEHEAHEADHNDHAQDGHDENEHEAYGHDDHEGHGHEPDQINAIFVGLSDRSAILGIQRALQTNPTEALSAVMPNVALLQLWSITGTAENALRLMSVAVAAASLIGMVVMLSATLDARRREFSILRSVGASPRSIFGLIVTEALVTAGVGILVGVALLAATTALTNPILSADYGFRISHALPNITELTLLLAVFCVAALASLLPAWRVYRITLSDGLAAKL
ncbi:FtsX-like permease family protein [Shimia sp. SK013]|uniref:ABC transporter permease n=1 Tax=Shimia sp. SK013 TaxID=1389006 RepID=UPI0006B40202|nr:ABC transporter permease [Shimia sp. SK013]KPA23142.1 FtsX-like permease family protein [Shimia sp. SK013]